MAVWEKLGLNATGAALGVGAAVVLIGGVYFIVTQRPPEPVTPVAVASPEQPVETGAVATETAQAPADTTANETSDASQSDTEQPATTTEAEQTATDAPTEQPADDVASAEETTTDEASTTQSAEVETPVEDSAPAAPAAPVFDVVRIDPEGSAVIAGTAEPGAVVELLLDGVGIIETQADAAGKFVALFDLGASDAPRNLTAVTRSEGGASPSDGAILIAPVRAPVAVAEAGPDSTATTETPQTPTETESVAEAPETDSAAAPETEEDTVALADIETETPVGTSPDVAPDAPEAPAVVVADSTGVRVLQPTEQPSVPGDSPEVTANVVIDTITYDTEGEVALAGRGTGEGFVRLYLNEQPIKTTGIEADGSWTADLPNVDAGVYTLRIDEVDASGAVTSRVETPFKREEPEIVEGTVQAVTVQPGFTLWGIAKERFGDGIQYVRVYEANRDLIRDPDLIYPGQVFALPN